jgi:6-phosphogluconolactonase
MQTENRWHLLDNADSVANIASQHILNSAQQAIAEKGCFKLVLAGGTTPEKIYRLLAQSSADWSNWFIYYGDERCLPADDAERNSAIAQNALLNHVAIPAEQIFTMPAELGNTVSAKEYSAVAAQAQPFDMVLLGVGEDGHTASLFPKHVHDENELVHAVFNSPKPPPERISLSAKVLSNTSELLFLITGANKKDAVQKWRAGEDLPVSHLSAKKGVDIYIDTAAYSD